ncbi:MAG: hypothetical protein Alis3KO_20150 [Aliiglaciecola sp.]
MTLTQCEFSIDRYKNVIYITITGVWTIQKDLEYISKLVEFVQVFKGREWGMCVDMRGWILPKEVFESPFKSKLMLNRRTQIAEVWIVDHEKQGDELLPYFKESKVVPFKVFTKTEALQYFKRLGIEIP